MHGHPVDADALLAHAEFVRALARRLVFDDDRVDDVVQETWLAALEHAPERPRSLRAWLARVVRNVAIKALRTDARRRRREEGAPEPRPPEPPPDAVDRLARGRQVVDAVLALDEPYRTTVVLRFYEDLEPSEIARRLGINGATVRTRLKRGLDMLRARLDRDAGGRRAWCLALLPVLVPHGKPVTGGILLMSAKSKLSIAAVLLLAAAVGLLVTWGAGGSGGVAQRASPATSASPRVGSEGASGTAAVAGHPAGATRVVVRVEDEAGRLLAGALVEAHRCFVWEMGISFTSEDTFFAEASPSRPVATATTDATGVAVFQLEATAHVYRATKSGFARADSGRCELRAGVEPDPVTLRLGPAYALAGLVVDEDGRPVAGAPVLAAEPAYGKQVPEYRIPARTVSDDTGVYRFDSLPPRDVAVWAAFPGGVPMRVAALRFPQVGRFDIVLQRGGKMSGTVTDADTGEPIAGARVRVMGYFQHRAEVYTDSRGRYEIGTLPATVLSTIRLSKEGYYQPIDPAKDYFGVRLHRGDSVRLDPVMRRAPVLSGTVRGPDGPLPDVTLQVSNGAGMFTTRTDGEGRYSVAAAPGRFVVAIAARGLRIPGALGRQTRPEDAKGDEGNVVDISERGETARDFALEPMGDLIDVHGRVTDQDGRPVAGARVWPDGSTAADGSFEARTWSGRPVWASKDGFAMGKSEPVEPGREALIVLARGPRISGTVTAPGGEAVEGAFVLVAKEPEADSQVREQLLRSLWLDATRVAADRAGRYEVRDLQPGRHFLRAGGRGQALTLPMEVVLEAGGERVLDFAVDPGVSLKGQVVEAGTGAPVPGAWVHAESLDPALRDPEECGPRRPSPEGETVVAVADASGAFVVESLDHGAYEIRAEARGFLAASTEASAGGATASVALERAFEIRGVATFPDGQPAAGLGVFAHRDGEPLSRFPGPMTSAQGRLVLEGLARGTYRVTVGGRTALSRTSGPVEAGSSDLRITVERAEPGQAPEYPEIQEGDATLEGRIVDPSGKGVAGAKVWASPMTAKRELLGRSTRSAADGRFVLRGVALEPHRVRALFEEGGWLEQLKEDVIPGRDTPTFVFASLSGTIVGADTEGRELVAFPLPWSDSGGLRTVVMPKGGRFEIAGLPPGRYDLHFNASKDRPQLLLEGGDDLEAGRRDLLLRASKGASISGVVVDEGGRPIAKATVSACDAHRGIAWVETPEDGRFELTGFRAGVAYDLSTFVDGRVPAKRRAEAPAADLRIVIETGFGASGCLLGSDGTRIARAQLRFVAKGHEAPERQAETGADGRFTVDGLRDSEYRVEMWPKVVLKPGDPKPEWQPVGTIRARDKDVELRMK
jgi:RNA polymerase sigma factor (sigma-70 family)